MSQMRVAVVTPYFREPLEWLEKCHDSVVGQSHPCTHFMVADGFPRSEVATWDLEHSALPRGHADYGNTPRTVGSLLANTQGYDAIAYLDADNWLYPDHIASMVELHEKSGAQLCSATRTIHRLDGSLMFVDQESDGKKHVDTSCLFLTRPLFRMITIWAMMPSEISAHCDRVFWQALLVRDPPRAHHDKPTIAFRSRYRVHYESLGETPPEGCINMQDMPNHPSNWWAAQPAEIRSSWLRYLAIGTW